MVRRVALFLVVSALMLGLALTAFAQDAPQAVLDALAALNAKLGTSLTLSNLASWSWEQQNFPDTSLGCPQSGTVYPQVVTNGYAVHLVYDGVEYDYRVSANRQTIFLCTDTSGAPGGTPVPGGSVTPTPSPSPTPLPAVAPTPTVYAPTGSVVCTGGLPTRLAVGMRARSSVSTSINIRNPPTLTDPNAVIGLLLSGGEFTVIGGPRCVDDRTWWQIEYDSAVGVTRGWVIEGDNVDYWLEPIGGTAVQAGQGQTVTGGAITASTAASLRAISQTTLAQGASAAVLLPNQSGDVLLINANGDSPQYYQGDAYAGVSIALSHAGQTMFRIASGPKVGGGLRYATLEVNPATPGSTLLYVGEITVGLSGVTAAEQFGVQLPMFPNALAFSPDGRLLAVACGDLFAADGTPNVVFLWDVTTGTQLAPIALDSAAADLAFSPDSTLLAISLPHAGVQLWSLAANTARALLPGASGSLGSTSLAFSPDGALLAVGTDDGQLVLWDVATATPRRVIQAYPDAQVSFVAFSPDGTALVSGGLRQFDEERNAGILLWDVASGTQLAAPAELTKPILALGFRPDGRALIGVSTASLVTWGVAG